MHDDTSKYAGAARDLAAERFEDVAEELASEGSTFLAAQMRRNADRVRNPKLISRIKAIVTPAGKAVTGTIKPGDPRIAEYIDKSPVLSSVFTPLGLAALISGGSYVAGANRAFQHNRVLGPLNEAQMRGEVPMSDPFNTFVHRRQKMAQEKTAGPLNSVGGMGDALGDLLKRFTTKQIAPDVTDNVMNSLRQRGISGTGVDPDTLIAAAKRIYGQGADIRVDPDGVVRNVQDQFSPGRAAATGLGVLGLGTVAAAADEPLAYQIEKALFGVDTRTRAQDKYVQSLASTAGSNTATMINDLLSKAIGGAAGAAQKATMSFSQENMFQRALDSDPLLREASDHELDMLRRAFGSMVRFAPQVATDEFAVKNFLREAMMAANGPDYGTLGNLARVNRAMTGEK